MAQESFEKKITEALHRGTDEASAMQEKNWKLIKEKIHGKEGYGLTKSTFQWKRALGTTEDNVIELAKGMGMKVPILVDENWLQRGYITIIRANWHLLSYEQLLTLLDWSADKLAHTLRCLILGRC
jgi:hypothetical protein